MESKKRLIPIGVLLIIGLCVPLIFKTPFYMQSAIYVVLYMYWASSWNILGGYTGLFALGNGLYIGIGAYTATLLFYHLGISPWIGMIVAGLVCAVLSVLIGYPVFRLKGMYWRPQRSKVSFDRQRVEYAIQQQKWLLFCGTGFTDHCLAGF